MKGDLQILNKHDHENAELLLNLSDEEILPYVDHLLKWMQDLNWPVARQIEPRLLAMGAKISQHLKPILESDDEMWIYGMMSCFIEPCVPLQKALKSELVQLKHSAFAFSLTEPDSHWISISESAGSMSQG